jgi:hypothetical protein
MKNLSKLFSLFLPIFFFLPQAINRAPYFEFCNVEPRTFFFSYHHMIERKCKNKVMTEETIGPSTYEIIQKPENKKWYVCIGGKEYGPWDEASKLTFTFDWRSWVSTVKAGGKWYMLIDGVEHGPFDRLGRERWFHMTHNAFVCTVIRGREIFLIEGGRMVKKGEIVEKSGETFLKIGGRSFGPYKKVTDLLFGACGRHWTADVEKRGRWHGFVVDGVEYGPFPRQFFGSRFSPDGSRWFVALDRGRENSVCSFILDGKTYGRFRIKEMIFLKDNRFLYTHTRRGKHFVVLENREIGPFLHDEKDCDMVGPDVWASMGFIKRRREKPRRCVIYIWIAGEDRYVFFSSNSGETLGDAIEIINAGNAGEGVYTEHAYIRLKRQSLGNSLDAEEGVSAEHAYIRLKHQSLGNSFSMVEQQHISHGEKHYNKLTVALENGKEESYFFDITSFYSKFSPEIERLVKTENR